MKVRGIVHVHGLPGDDGQSVGMTPIQVVDHCKSVVGLAQAYMLGVKKAPGVRDRRDRDAGRTAARRRRATPRVDSAVFVFYI